MSKAKMSRDGLISLAQQIQDPQDRGRDYKPLLRQLQEQLVFSNVAELFVGDYSAEYIVDFSLGWKAEWPRLSRAEMVDLVTKPIDADGTQAELAILTLKFDANCSHPGKNGLIYYPEEFFPGNPDPSPSEIVDKAMSKDG